MSACILPSNPDYRKLLSETQFDEKTLHSIVQQYWKEHPEKGIDGHEVYPSKEYVNSFFETATTTVDAGLTIRFWRRDFRNPVEVKSPEEEKAFRDNALQYFNEDAILSYSTREGKRYIRVARPILESEGRGFEFNREQKYAISKISNWFMDKSEGRTTDEWIVLEGEAGTGKTSIINDILLNALSIHGQKIMIGAVSNQATDNIQDKLSDQVKRLFDIDRKTVAGMLGLKMDTSTEKKGFVEDSWSGKPILSADAVIVDEASMVTEQFIDLTKQAAKRGIPILFIGDEAQIRPIREGQWFVEHPVDKNADAPVFTNRKNTEFISLTERVRQGEDSPILDFAHAYRESWKNNTHLPTIPGRKSSVDGRLIFTAKRATELLNDLIPIFQEAIKTNNPNLIHIVPYNRDYLPNYAGIRPRSALWWNQKIYDALHPEMAGKYVYQKGDLVRFDEDFALSENESIHNSDNAQVVQSSDERKDSNGVRYRMVTLDWKGRTITVPVISQDLENVRYFETVKRNLFKQARERKISYPDVHKYIDSYAKVILSYALNVHRAQGSTYDITVLDQDNIDSAPNVGGFRDNASLGYTAATRAKNVLLVASSKADEKDMNFDLLAVNKKFNDRRGKPNPFSDFGKLVDAATKTSSRGIILNSPTSQGTFSNITENTVLNASDVLSSIVSGELSSTVSNREKAYAKALIPLVTSAGVKIKFIKEGTPNTGAAGHTYPQTRANITAGNDIEINLVSFKNSKVPARVILHEVTHSLSSDRLKKDAAFRKNIQDILDYVKSVVKPVASVDQKTYETVNKNGEIRTYVVPFDIYGLYNVEEFFSAVMTEEPFQEMLKAIPAKNENKTLWEKIVSSITTAFNRVFNRRYNTNKSVYDAMVPIIAGVMTHEAYVGRAYAESSFPEFTDEQVRRMDDVVEALLGSYTPAAPQPKDIQTESEVKTIQENTREKNQDKPQGNIQTDKQSYFLTKVNQNISDQQKFAETNLLITTSDVSEKQIVDDIIDNIQSGKHAIGTRLVPDIHGTVDDIIRNVRILRSAQSREGSFVYRGVSIPASISRFTEEELARLSRTGIENDGTNVLIPSFTVGLTEKELSDIIKRERIAKTRLFNSSEIRSIGVKILWKVSDIVTKLQTKGQSASKEFLSSLGEISNTDFTGRERLDIIREVGIDNLINAAYDSLMPYKEDDTVRTVRKKQFVKENLDIIVEQAQDFLAKNEEIGLTSQSTKKSIINTPLGGQLTETFDVDGEVQIAELEGSTAEHWMINFRQVSAVSSLSSLIRRNLSSLLMLNNDGSAMQDEFGPKLLDVHQAVLDMLHWVSGAKDSNEMMRILESKMGSHPWTRQLVGQYYEDGNLDGNLKNGILVGEENSQLRSKFFTNFSKFFQSYIVMYKDNEDNTMLRGVNTNTYSEQVIQELRTLDQGKYTDNGLTIWKKEGGLSEAFNELRAIVGYQANDQRGIPASGLVAASQQDKVTDEILKKIQRALEILDITPPSLDEIKTVVVTPQQVAWIANKLKFIVDGINKLYKDDAANFTLFGKNNSVLSDIKDLLKVFEPVMSTSMEAVAYEAGKMHYGYVNPSFMNMFVRDLQGNVADYDAFMRENFLNYTGWFYTPEDHKTLAGKGYLNYWIELLNAKDDRGNYVWRGVLDHTASLSFEGVGYSDKPSAMIGASYLQAYFYDTHKASAWYRVMLLSNKPSEEYIKFVRLSQDYQRVITDSVMRQMLMAEINRIKTVAERLAKVEKGVLKKDVLIASMETKAQNGLHFQFLKFLNDEIEQNTRLGKLTKALYSSDSNVNLSDGSHVDFVELFKQRFGEFMDRRFEEFLDNIEAEGVITRENGEITSVYGVQDKIGTGVRARNNLREFFWNDWFAQANMFQIFMGDIAQYSNAEDIQKRAAQLHAPGMRPDLAAIDERTHEPISDGYQRIMLVEDIIERSDVVDALKKIHARILSDPKYSIGGKLTELGKQKAAVLKRIRDSFEEVNWTDGQALISPTGLRKKMHMFGNWTPHMEEVYDKILKGDFTNKDLDVLWPVIKPFSYSLIDVNTHTTNGKYMPFYRTAIQQKDSEFTLILVDALARSVGVDTKFAALYDVMEGSSVINGMPIPDGIDGIQFDSTIKTGLSGALDISKMSPDEIRQTLRQRMQSTGALNIRGERRMYNPDYVKEIPFRDWSQQQEVPFHFEGQQQMGSQPRILQVSDAANTSVNANGQVVDNMITVNTENGIKTMTVKQAKQDYFTLLADNILDSAKDLGDSLSLGSKNKKLRNIALSRLLQEELSRDGRYGLDMLRAVSVDKNGDFITPLSDPMLAGPIQQMMNALIKNRVYKQMIEGGPLVQVSSFGHSKDLKVVTDEKTGRPLYAEVIISAPAEWYEIPEFLDENGELSIEKINEINPKILEMIGYRIPTEGKYSMLPFKVVGFMSRGTEGIMLPKEITVLSGSDFDVDKLYVMRRAFERKKDGTITLKTDNIRNARNNEMLDYAWAFITSDLCADQTLSAGNFDAEKKVAYTIAAADNNEYKGTLIDFVNSLRNLKASSIKDMAYKPYDLLFMDTQMKFFKQNMVAAKLIGIFAQSNISHAFVSLMSNEGKNPSFKIADGLKFTVRDINGNTHTLSDDVTIDAEYDWSGLKRISTVFAELIGASVDSVKDPVFNLMNVNLATANILSTMLRIGWDIESVAWFLTTPVIKELVKRYNLSKAEENVNIQNIVSEMQSEVMDGKPDNFQETYAWGREDFINYHNLEVKPVQRDGETNDEFVTRSIQQGHTNWQLLELFSRMQGISDTMRSVIHMTRINSIAAAPGPYAANTLVDRIKTAQFDNNPNLDGLREAISNPVLSTFRRTVDVLVDRILGENLIQAGPIADKIYTAVQDYYGYISNDMAQKMSEFMMSYLVNYRNPVFDTSFENRRYMLLGFPTIFISAKNRYPNNLFLKSITMRNDTSGRPLLELKTRGMEDSDIQNFKAAWEDLYKEEEKRLANLGSTFKKHENENLALKLVEYNYFRGGMGFDPKTFMRVVPESIKDILPNYRQNTRSLETVDSDSFDGEFIKNLLYQFMLNTGVFNMSRVEGMKIEKNPNTGNLFVEQKEGDKYGLKPNGIVPVKSGKNTSYYGVHYNISAGIYELVPVQKLGGDNFGFEIDPNIPYYAIQSVFNKQTGNKQTGNPEESDDFISRNGDMNLDTHETNSTTIKLMNSVLGNGWMNSGKPFVESFRNMTDKFMSFWSSGMIDNITKDDKFVRDQIASINWNLSRNEVEEMIKRVTKKLDEQNICR